MNSNAHKLTAEQTDSPLSDVNQSFLNLTETSNLAALPFLAASSFKNSSAFSRALDILSQQLRAANPDAYHHDEHSFKVSLAENIVATLVKANMDYASKLELIACAANHRLFKPKFSLWQLAAGLARHIPFISNYINEQPTDAELILAAGKKTLMTSRSKIILG